MDLRTWNGPRSWISLSDCPVPSHHNANQFKSNEILFQVGMDNKCAVMIWNCVADNHTALAFYKHQGAEDLAETEAWRNLVIERSDLEKLANS